MACDGVTQKHIGECTDCECPGIVSPVCGENGQTYPNSCQANCDGVLIINEGQCVGGGLQEALVIQRECRCPKDYDPVCGANYRTYQNYCEAECEGM